MADRPQAVAAPWLLYARAGRALKVRSLAAAIPLSHTLSHLPLSLPHALSRLLMAVNSPYPPHHHGTSTTPTY
jgi:hypothetical protein